jgi:F-type H+-transporting ATPase subunit b
MPQLEITTYPSQIFWLVVSFLTLYLIMSRIIIPRISSVIKNRESQIKNNIHISEQLYKDTEIINDELEKVRKDTETEAKEIINNLKETTNKKISENYELLKKKLEKKLEKDEQKILLRKKKTLKEINKISLNLSEEIIRKISNGKSEQKNKLKSIIKKNLEEVS